MTLGGARATAGGRGLSTVDALAAALRREILDGARPGGSRLRERELCEAHGIARHSLRAALRALAVEGLVRLEPHRGARVARLGPGDVRSLYELRAALELEAVNLALERHGGRLPATAGAAQRTLARACAGPAPAWSAVTDAHLALHGSLVAAAASPRIADAYATLAGELRLFLVQLRPHYSGASLVREHAALLAAIERDGPAPLREHLRRSAARLTAPGGQDRDERTSRAGDG